METKLVVRAYLKINSSFSTSQTFEQTSNYNGVLMLYFLLVGSIIFLQNLYMRHIVCLLVFNRSRVSFTYLAMLPSLFFISNVCSKLCSLAL
jgi:hypothetical protein